MWLDLSSCLPSEECTGGHPQGEGGVGGSALFWEHQFLQTWPPARERHVIGAHCHNGRWPWFSYIKDAFRDALAQRCGWQLQHLPDCCACGGAFSVDHGQWRARLGASESTGTTISVTSQPQLQPLMTESLVLPSARVADGHRPDIRQKGCGPTRDTFVNVRLFHPDYPSYLSTAVPARKHFEREKKLQYVQRVREVEIGSFTPIVFFPPREMGAEAQTFFRRVAG